MSPSRRGEDLRLAALVLEGYLYIALVLAFLLGALAFFGWGLATRRPVIALIGVGLGLPIALAAGAAIRALLRGDAEPYGLELGRGEAPALFAMVDDLRRRIRAPRIQRIVIGQAVNATAMQTHRLLVFHSRNELRLGYPLLVALSPEHLRAIVAHELGHFSRAHGRFAAWVYRTRLAWVRLVHTLHARGAAPLWVYWLHRFYLPRLDAQASRVSRRQELVADRCAADVVGPRAAADALVAIDLLTRHHDEVFWPAFRERLEGDPDLRPYAAAAAELSRWTARDEGWLDEALRRTSDPEDTHPALAERLEAIGETARMPPAPDRSAGEAYLDTGLDGLTRRLDEEWAERYGEAWRVRHAEVRVDRERLAELRMIEAPSAKARLEMAGLVERLEGAEAALPLYRAAAEAGSARAGLEAGRVLLERGEEDGVALVETAMAADESLVLDGCELLVPFHEERGRLHEAERCRTRGDRQAMRERLAAEEREAVTPLDRLVAHGLADADVAAVRAGLARHPSITGAWLARREFRHARGDELLMLVSANGGATDEIERLAAAAVPGGARVLRRDRAHPEVRRRLEGLPGAAVYP